MNFKILFPFGLLATLLTACVIVHAIAKSRLQARCKLMLKKGNNKTWETEWKMKYLKLPV